MSPRRKLHWGSLVVLATGILFVGPVGTLAQSTTATCMPSFSWAFNSKNQSPCLVAAYLQGACNGGQFSVPALPNNTHYTGPYASEQNPCQCSSVTYNVISACGLCQNHTIIDWSVWDFNCSTLYPGVFPPGVPDGTAVPQWAFQDVTTSNVFNATLAEAVGDNPESTASHPQSTGSAFSTSTASGVSVTALSSPTSSGTKSNTGAIAGGVVGGVIGVALIAAVVIFFMMKKKRSRIPPTTQFPDQTSHAAPSTIYTDTTPFVPQMVQPKLYDPSDPSTFPVTPPPPTIMSGSSQDVPISPHYSSPSVRAGGFYSGAPEI